MKIGVTNGNTAAIFVLGDAHTYLYLIKNGDDKR